MHVGQYRVRYRDVYSAGVVLNARYLDICDEAFTEFFRALGFTSADLSAVPFDGALAHMDAMFASTSTVDDVLDMDVICERVGSSSVVLVYTLTRDDQKVFQGVARYVNVDESGTPTPIPDALRTALAG
ncbi:MAG: acyl-CoA thioesterase [Candidatus Nanopelagicales bacterium]|nr:acyl-CoA thioesterase [Candidatus Nanopelagicales bacterium]